MGFDIEGLRGSCLETDRADVAESSDDPESLLLCSLPCLLTYPDGTEVMLRRGSGRPGGCCGGRLSSEVTRYPCVLDFHRDEAANCEGEVEGEGRGGSVERLWMAAEAMAANRYMQVETRLC